MLRHQDRRATRARALTDDLLAIRRWHGGAERLLLANFGDAPAEVRAAGLKQLGLADAAGWRRLYATPNAAAFPSATRLDEMTVQPRAAVLLAH